LKLKLYQIISGESTFFHRGWSDGPKCANFPAIIRLGSPEPCTYHYSYSEKKLITFSIMVYYLNDTGEQKAAAIFSLWVLRELIQ
jgi:hypothetical protein